MITHALASLLASLVQATVKGSLMILLVAALSALIARRIDARWRHLLWVIVLVRLAMPSAPEWRWSVFNLMPGGERVARSGALVEVRHATIASIGGGGGAEVVSVRPAPLLLFARWIVLLWIAGALVLAVRTLIATLRTRRAIAAALRRKREDAMLERLLAEGCARLRIRSSVRIVESDVVRTPALHGLFRPVLVLPTGLSSSFSIEELRYVILHELWHLRRMDVAVSWALSAVQTLHWFNPLVWFAASRIKEERELACDELALSCLEEEERFGYGRTILKLLESFRAAAPVPALVGIVNGKHKMKRRLTMIASFRNRTRFSMLFLLVVAAVGAAALTDAQGGEQRMIIRHADPAALPTIERLSHPVTVQATNVSLGDFLGAVANAAGVTVMQSPDIAALPVQQAKFSVNAENVPPHTVLQQALLPFGLIAEPSANGITISKGADCNMVRHEATITESNEGGQQKVERHVIVVNGKPGDLPAVPDLPDVKAGASAGATQHRFFITAKGDGNACTFDANGKLHRELTLNIDQDGKTTAGKLTLDIQK